MCVFFQLEKKLKAQIDAWESEQGREFLVNGQKFLQYVEEQWELHRIEKEQEKLERVTSCAVGLKTCCLCILRNVLTLLFTSPEQHLKKSKQTEEDMLYGTTVRTPTKRRFLGTTTPNKSRKVVNSLCGLLLSMYCK